MSSQASYAMHGFNVSSISSCRRIIKLNNNIEYSYKDHSILKSVFIDENLSKIIFTLRPGIEAKDHKKEISDELEKICFNIIVYTEVPTSQPCCTLESITDEKGTEIEISDSIQMSDRMEMCITIETSDFYKSIMDKNTKLIENKAKYKELFYILHNPHKAIQFIALYDILLNLICSSNERGTQKKVTNFFGMNRNKYSFIEFIESKNNPKNKVDTFTNLRNNIAHSKEAGIEDFQNIYNSITDKQISQILSVINDIISCGIT